jgi:outer membrane protein assembly factor BamB
VAADPEAVHRRITSGDAGGIGERAELLRTAADSLDGAVEGVHDASGTVVWTGDGASAFLQRTTSVLQGAVGGRVLLNQTAHVLEKVATAYGETCDAADESISFWRKRPAGMPSILEDLLAGMVTAQLKGIADGWNGQLAAGTAILNGDAGDLDLDDLDDETRKWVERGLDRTDDWLDEYGSTNGPLIPNTKATGDDRGLTPQGLGYDPASGMLLQTYYKDGEPAVLSVIDPNTGEEVNEVTLSPGASDPTGSIGHAGGVTVDGDNVYVSSGGKIYTYSLEGIRGADEGGAVAPSAPAADVDGHASYTTFHGGKLYVGDFDGNTLYVYDKGPGGSWVPSSPPSYETPPRSQGVVVRDDGFIYSTSEGRTKTSTMVVQHGHGDYDKSTADAYEFPNMAEGVVEVDGQLVATYESGSSSYQHAKQSFWDQLLGRHDDGKIWASPFMTKTPLSALGLGPGGAVGEIEAEPQSLTKAATAMADPASTLKRQAGILEGMTLPAHVLGDVPAAGGFSSAVTGRADAVAGSVQMAATGVERLGDALDAASHRYVTTDDHVGGGFSRLSGRLR